MERLLGEGALRRLVRAPPRSAWSRCGRLGSFAADRVRVRRPRGRHGTGRARRPTRTRAGTSSGRCAPARHHRRPGRRQRLEPRRGRPPGRAEPAARGGRAGPVEHQPEPDRLPGGHPRGQPPGTAARRPAPQVVDGLARARPHRGRPDHQPWSTSTAASGRPGNGDATAGRAVGAGDREVALCGGERERSVCRAGRPPRLPVFPARPPRHRRARSRRRAVDRCLERRSARPRPPAKSSTTPPDTATDRRLKTPGRAPRPAALR